VEHVASQVILPNDDLRLLSDGGGEDVKSGDPLLQDLLVLLVPILILVVVNSDFLFLDGLEHYSILAFFIRELMVALEEVIIADDLMLHGVVMGLGRHEELFL